VEAEVQALLEEEDKNPLPPPTLKNKVIKTE
jgi:hypothetical protein